MRNFPVWFKMIMLTLLVIALTFEHRWESWLAPLSDPLEKRLLNLFNVLLNFLTFTLSFNLLIIMLVAVYRRRKRLMPNQVDNMVIGLENIYYIILTVSILIGIAGFFGFAPKELFTSLSIVAAAIAVISKDFISEIISGMIIAFSKELSIDDYIKIGDQKGKIIDITLTKIALLNDDDDVIFLPNNKVYTSEIVNYTKKEIKKVNIDFEVDIKAFRTIEELEADLTQELADYREHIVPRSYALKVVGIRKDSLSMKFQYVLHQIDRDLERDIRRKTARRVVNYVKNNLSTAAIQDQAASATEQGKA